MTNTTAGKTAPSLKIRMFGALVLTIEGRPLKTRTPKDLHVLAYLLTHHNAEVDRDHLAALFWYVGRDGTPIGVSDRLLLLSRSLSELGAALGDERIRLQKPTPRTLRFVTEGASMDLATFDAGLAQGDAVSLVKAASLYRSGTLLEGWSEPWVLEARAEIKARYLDALEKATHRARVEGDPEATERCLRLALETDPRRETLLLALLQLLTEERQFEEARRQYEAFCRLAEQEAREPGPEVEQVFRRLREVAQRFEASPQAGAIPLPLSSFVPREEEIEEVKGLLMASMGDRRQEGQDTVAPLVPHFHTRLLTLTGSGGVGKSRLALEVARRVRENYFDRAWFVDLATLSDASLLVPTVASVLGVQTDISPEALAEFLRPKRLLLLLDNCEHLIQACARLTTDLLSACPHLCILATSREKLGLVGEEVWRVPSLAFPDPSSGISHPASLLEYGAVQLFIERASLPQQPFVLTAGNAAAVTKICARLDGIPLAIELAAMRVRALPLEQLASRLDDYFRMLAGGARTALLRHQTLWATLDWSYTLLSAQEQLLLCRLCVFAGGWTLEAAEQVCAGEGVESYDVLDLLTRLVDKSLVLYEPRASLARYRLLDTIRQYARDRLRARGQGEAIRRRHRDYFLAWTEINMPDREKRMEVEHDNLRAAMDFCREAEDGAEPGLRLVLNVENFWSTCGYWREGRQRIEEALAHPKAAPTMDWLDARVDLARIRYFDQGVAAGQADLEQCLAAFREVGDNHRLAVALQVLSYFPGANGDFATARAYLEKALALLRADGDRQFIPIVLRELGMIAYKEADYETAWTLIEEAHQLDLKKGQEQGIARFCRGMVKFRQGDLMAARSLLCESVVAYAAGSRFFIIPTLQALAFVATEQQQWERAAHLLGAADRRASVLQGASWLTTYLTVDDLPDCITMLKSRLGEAAFTSAWNEGMAMTLKQAVVYALE